MHRGYIKLYRKIVNWEWAKDIKTFRLFIHLLLDANKDPGLWRGVKTERGELITSLGSLSDATGLTVNEVRTALSHLQETGEITVQSTKFYTLIHIVNYGIYQGFEQFEQQSGSTPSAESWQRETE